MRAPHRLPRSLRISAVAAVALGILLGGSAAFQSIPVRTPLDALASYQPQTRCDARSKPGVVAFRKLVLERYPGTRDLGIINNCAPGLISEHYEGRAWDWGVRVTVPRERAAADDLIKLLLRPDSRGNPAAMARRLGVMYMIWNRRIWGAYRLSEGWRPYNGKEAHDDHIHFSFGWAGAFGCTSYWKAVRLPASSRCDHLDALIASSGTPAPPPPPPRAPAKPAPPKAAPARLPRSGPTPAKPVVRAPGSGTGAHLARPSGPSRR